MMKFFRKYTKQMLAVFLALLLVVWLGGAAFENMIARNQSSIVLARSVDGEITQSEHLRVDSDTSILNAIGIGWQYLAQPLANADPLAPQEFEPLDNVDWLLLCREATRFGQPMRLAEVAQTMNAQGLTEQTLARVASRLDVSVDRVYAAVGRYLDVQRVLRAFRGACGVGEAELRTAARDTLERVRIQMVSIPLDPFINPEAEFTETQINEQFNKHKADVPGDGMAFGYYLQPRIAVRYVRVDVNALADELRISEATLERRARNYWKENRESDPAFVKPPEEGAEPQADDVQSDEAASGDPATNPASRDGEGAGSPSPTDDSAKPVADTPEGAAPNAPATSAPDGSSAVDESPTDPDPQQAAEPAPAAEPAAGESATATVDDTQTQTTGDADQPAEPGPATPAEDQDEAEPKSRYFESFRAARAAALDVVRRQLADSEGSKIIDQILRAGAEPWFEQQRGEDGYRTMPPGVDAPGYYADLVANLPPAMQYDKVISVAVTDAFTQAEAHSVSEIGAASMPIPGGTEVPFASLAFNVQGLVEIPEAPGVDRSQYLALFEPVPTWLRDADGNYYVFQVIKVLPGREPTTADEVREAVIEDLRMLQAQEQATKRVSALKPIAIERGLQAAWEADEDLQAMVENPFGFEEPLSFPRQPFIAQFGLYFPARVGGLGEVGDTFVERCFELGERTDDGPRLAVLTVDNPPAVVLVQWLETLPVREDEYAAARADLQRSLEIRRAAETIAEWLRPANIRSRSRYEVADL